MGASSKGPSAERLARKHQQALFADYFQLLEVERSADALTIARAVAGLSQEFDPAGAADLAEAEATKVRLVAAVLREAAAVLSDPALRACYREHLGGAA